MVLVDSVYSYFAPMQEAGPFQIGLQTKRAQANDVLKVTRDVLQQFLAEGPSDAELRAAKANIVGVFAALSLKPENPRQRCDHRLFRVAAGLTPIPTPRRFSGFRRWMCAGFFPPCAAGKSSI